MPRKTYMLHSASWKFLIPCLCKSCNTGLTDNGPFLSFQATICCDVLGFVPTGSFSSSSTLQIFQDASYLWWLLCTPVLSAGSSFLTLACPGQYAYRSLWRWILYTVTCRCGLQIPFSLFAACSVKLWGWWYVWSDCHLLRQTSGEHVWLLLSMDYALTFWVQFHSSQSICPV